MPPLKTVARVNVSLSVRPACATTERIHLQATMIDQGSLVSAANISPRIGII